MNNNHIVDNNVETKSSGSGWRILVGIIAIGIIGFLVFPLLQPQQTSNEGNIDSVSAEAQFELGNDYYETGDLEKAVAAYKKAVELDPTYQAAYANLGVTYYQQQQFDLAASQYEKALELNPEDGEVAYNLGALYLQQALSQGSPSNQDLINQAIVQLEKALEISPDLAEPHFTLGVAYFFLNQKEESIQEFEIFLSLEPADQNSQARQEAQSYLDTLHSQ